MYLTVELETLYYLQLRRFEYEEWCVRDLFI